MIVDVHVLENESSTKHAQNFSFCLREKSTISTFKPVSRCNNVW